jgi:hypothetical protein
MPILTPDQITALAPDPGSAKSGRELASARKWVSLGKTEGAAWGECQGSAKEPYQTQIDLSEPAFKCSCPSRKFPCKHGLGLFLLLAAQPGAFKQQAPPAWVTEWLAKRAANAQKAKEKSEKVEPAVDTAGEAARPAPEKTQRSARREERIRQGLEDLDLWLSDLARQGLSAVQSKPASFWETPAARLVDAQAPGLARRVRGLAAIPGAGEGWQERLLAQAAKLYLLLRAYQNLAALPAPAQADVRAQVGWTLEKDELLLLPALEDRWHVLAKKVEEDTSGRGGRGAALKTQRTWLLGQASRRPALVLSFAAPGQVLDTSLIPGTSLTAELVFYPGGFPLRALVKRQVSPCEAAPGPEGFADVTAALAGYAAALAANPWLEVFPMLLNNVIPARAGAPAGETWHLRDQAGRALPLAPGFGQAWTLAAMSGGLAVDLFCEWNGETLYPLAGWSGGRFVLLAQVKGED